MDVVLKKDCETKAICISKGLYSKGGSGLGRKLKASNHEALVSAFLKVKYGCTQKWDHEQTKTYCNFWEYSKKFLNQLL